MALQDYVKEEFVKFVAVCKDDMMQENKITKGKKYLILGEIFGFYIIRDDSGKLEKISKARFDSV